MIYLTISSQNDPSSYSLTLSDLETALRKRGMHICPILEPEVIVSQMP